MSKNGSLESLGPLDSLQLDSELSLHPRIKLLLTIFRADKSVAPIDDWKVKRSLIEYLKSSHSIVVSEDEKDLQIRKFKDLKKRKREEPIARGALVIRDLGFLSGLKDDDNAEKKFLEWRKDFVEKMDGIELNLEGSKFKLCVALPPSDDFETMRKEWEEMLAFGNRG